MLSLLLKEIRHNPLLNFSHSLAAREADLGWFFKQRLP